MLIKMDSEAFVEASLWVGLIVFHHKTSDALRLALYQIIDRNWQNYEQGIMSQPHIVNEWKHNLGFSLADDLRELAVTIKRVGVTASQCALGSRVAMIM